MPFIYCQCGYKNNFSSTKPKKCSSCDEPLEVKPAPKHHHEQRVRYEEPPEEVFEPEYNEDAVKASILLHREESDNTFMTVEQLRKSQAAITRGDAPVDANLREEILGTLMGTREAAQPQPPFEGRGGARRVNKLSR